MFKNSKWQTFNYGLNNNILSNTDIENSLNQFSEEILKDLSDKEYILIQFKVKDSLTGAYSSISCVNTIKKSDLKSLKNTFIEYWSIKDEEYHAKEIKFIVYAYKILFTKDVITKIIPPKNIIKSQNKFKWHGYSLPCTMDLTSWGRYHIYDNYSKAIVYKSNSKAEYHISLYESYQNVELKIDDKILLTFTDKIIDVNNLSSFERIINKNQKYIFENGLVIYKEIKRKFPYLKKVNPSIYITQKIITMDLETRVINNAMEAYCVSLYDGEKFKSFYLTDFNNSDDMLKNAILYLMKRKYNGYKIYLHNFSNFDSVFLLKILSGLSNDIKPIIRNNKIIDIKFKFSSYTIYFRDSYLLLPLSLSKLAKSFNVDNKLLFPYKFLNEGNVSLNYSGEIPEYKYFDKISIEEYKSYCESLVDDIWNLRNESIKYCEHDVKILYLILETFNKKIFKHFRINIYNYPTLPSLAFAIYRSNFLSDYKIPLITGRVFYDIKNSYTGGSTDLYKPYGENLYCYDVNSLYPFVMKNNPVPVGQCIYFEGDLNLDNKPFGFFEVEVTSPKDLNIPLLQNRFKMEGGIRTITPLGQWKNFYFSEELYKAKELGYNIKIIRGYIFEKGYIFKEYVDYLYNWKINSSKNSINYITSKMLLNSLYGRFGMSQDMVQHLIINGEDSLKYYKEFDVLNVLPFDNNKELISYTDNSINGEDNTLHLNISIPIASAITAYSRIFMYNFKNLEDTILYYSDTDSIFINKPLPDHLVGNDLGKMKLEYISNKSVFLSPKVYGSITEHGEIVKIKGSKNIIPFNELYQLLYKDHSYVISHDKWYKNISKGYITIKKELYTLLVTNNKRKLIYENNKLINTKPYIIDHDKLIN